MNTQPIVIIGSGLAGYMLAKEFRKLDTETPLIIITESTGEFYSKPLLSTALTQNKTADTLAMFTAQEMQEQLNAKIYTQATVESIDIKHREVIIKNKKIDFSQLILACGAKTIDPPLKGNAVQAIHQVNNLQDYRQFRQWLEGKKRIAVLGAGLVGCEFANDLVNAGFDVDVIAPESYPLSNLIPEPIAGQLILSLQEKGVDWHLGHLAVAVDQLGAAYQITLSNGDTVQADGVVSAIGLRPALSLAKSAGLKTNRGICVNRFLQTSEPNIFALGDCAEVAGQVKFYVAPLLQCARALAKILTGGQEPVHYPAMPVVIKTPACPIVTSPPPVDVKGEWHIEGDAAHLRALFHDQAGQLRGFSLIGDKIRDKMPLAKQLPLVFESEV